MRVSRHIGLAALVLLGCGAKTGLEAPSASRTGDATVRPDRDGGLDGDTPPDAPGRDARPRVDAGPVDGGPPPPPPPCRRPVPVDMLVVVDDSSSMLGAQRLLAEQLPLLVRSLVTPPDHDGDGRGDWPAPTDLHIGVVPTSEGSCAAAATGRLISTDECGGGSGRFLSWRTGDSVERVTDTFACMATVGAMGCEREQSFNTAMRALLPGSAPFDTCGLPGVRSCKGDGANEEFLREDSLLVLMLLTNEDDVSESGPAEPNIPVSDFVDAMRSLRPDPDRFVYAPITGVPERLVEEPSEADPSEILRAPELDRTAPEPSCRGEGAIGFSPVRLVEAAAAFDDRSVIGSICSESYEPVVGAAARFIGTRACDD